MNRPSLAHDKSNLPQETNNLLLEFAFFLKSSSSMAPHVCNAIISFVQNLLKIEVNSHSKPALKGCSRALPEVQWLTKLRKSEKKGRK